MQRLKLALSCALLAAVTGVAVQAVLLPHAATQATRALRAAVSAEIQATRADISNKTETFGGAGKSSL
jgi:Skp family chaperone for outer membrane proteins